MTVTSSDDLLQTSVKDFMERDFPSIKETANIAETLGAFKSRAARVLYTVKDSGALSGVITPCDLVKLNDATKPETALNLATTEKVVGVRQDAELWQLLKIMNGENVIGKQFDQLPVLDSNNKPVGIVRREALREALGSISIPVKS